MKPIFWRVRLKAGFTDDFNILEVTVELPEDGTSDLLRNEDEFLGWDEGHNGEKRDPIQKKYRVNVGLAISFVGLCLGVLSII
ncbi:hypothetical protein [Stappia indica]|uniref:Uncharacterized protein n=1 Tax=Stappia indica TaxID=538381 RepID=A0A285SJK4_9HYPH|nr:hypothetical protein [Stappia indica]SOC06323.1 hypothetical protein SAMN05421512_10561 [Stappia indica]